MRFSFLLVLLAFCSKAQEQPKFTLLGHGGGVNSITLSEDGKWLASGAKDETFRIWDLTVNVCNRTVKTEGSSVKRVSYSNDGSRLLVALYTRFMEYDVKTGKKKLSKKNSHTAFVESCIYSPDGKSILTSSWRDNSISLWKANLKKSLDMQESNWIDNAIFSLKGDLIYSGGHDNLVKCWDPVTGNMIFSLAGHDDWVYDICLSPDGKLLYSGGFDKVIKVWELSTKKNIATYKGHSEGIVCVDISADGKLIAGAGTDKEIIIWNTGSGAVVKRIKAHDAAITDLKFSKDAKTLYSASLDKTIKAWDLTGIE